MGMEYERKFAATPDLVERMQKELGGVWTEYRMQTTYYDTQDGALSARKWMLRHRLENDHHVCTLKTPAGDARCEWEVTAERIEDGIEALCELDVPAQLRALTQGGVQPVCGAQFLRLATTLTLDGAEVEVALDRGILFAQARTEPLCEVEVELKSGCREAADGFADCLAKTYGLQTMTKSKFKRALALKEQV